MICLPVTGASAKHRAFLFSLHAVETLAWSDLSTCLSFPLPTLRAKKQTAGDHSSGLLGLVPFRD